MADLKSIESGIYCITCVPTGKIYIGSAVNFGGRWKGHRCCLRQGKHHSRYLQFSWNKYGSDAFTFNVVELVADPAKLIDREQWHLDHTRSYDPKIGFNVSPTAGSSLGVRHSVETRANMVAARRGKKRSSEAAANIAAAQRTPEARAKMSAALQRPEVRAKLAAGQRGRTASPETRAKMSAAKCGKPLSEEHRAKMAALLCERNQSQEQKEKVSKAQLGKTHTPESRAKMSAAHLGKTPWNKQENI
jgi:group I intron endonuclease